MPGYPCPSCGRALRVGDDLWGALVKCPMCGTEFQTPPEPPSPQPRAARGSTEWKPRRTPERPPPAVHVPVGDERGARPEPALNAAAAWLQVAVALQGISGLLCCCVPALSGEGEALVFTFPVTLVLKYLPLLLAAVASSRIAARRSLGLCRAGAILLVWTSFWGVLEVLVGIILLSEQRRMQSPGIAFQMLLAVLSVPGTLCGFIASGKTLTALARVPAPRTYQ